MFRRLQGVSQYQAGFDAQSKWLCIVLPVFQVICLLSWCFAARLASLHVPWALHALMPPSDVALSMVLQPLDH